MSQKPYTAEDCIKLAHSYVSKLQNQSDSEYDDLVQIFTIAAFEAGESGDRDKGIRSYQYESGRGAVLNHFRMIKRERKNMPTVSLDAIAFDAGEAELTYLDVIEDKRNVKPLDHFAGIDGENRLKGIINDKNSTDREIIDFLLQGKTYEEIGGTLGCSRNNVSLKVKRIREEIAARL